MPAVTRFLNAPLIEVIAELRWGTGQDGLFQQAGIGFPIQIPDAVAVANDQFYARFAEKLDDEGFRNSERLVPYGAPTMPGQPAVRFRRKAGQPPLLQVGNGVFTANGLPPTYTHWGDFRPVLRMGVETLLSTREASETGPFTLMVRYIDAFKSGFWEDGDAGRFVDEVLGFGSTLPGGLQEQLDTTRPKSASHSLSLPLSDGSTIVINVGEGNAEGQPAVVLDVVTRTEDVVPDVGAIMDAFETNHRTIRDLFTSVTEKVRHLMEPVEIQEQ
jgi:uncharacterized protein (TIGR04255 family)